MGEVVFNWVKKTERCTVTHCDTIGLLPDNPQRMCVISLKFVILLRAFILRHSYFCPRCYGNSVYGLLLFAGVFYHIVRTAQYTQG